MSSISNFERIKDITKDAGPCIYAIFNNNNERIYIGESQTPIKRLESHRNALKLGTHANKKLQDDYNKGHDFTFSKLRNYTKDDEETIRYRELETMKLCKDKGFILYNLESNLQIESLLQFNSKTWKLHCEMEKKRDEYYKKYFGCTYYQFCYWNMVGIQRKSDDYMKWKIKQFYEKREKEIKKEIEEERKQFLTTHKRISIYLKKDLCEKIKSISSNNPEKYISKIIEETLKF